MTSDGFCCQVLETQKRFFLWIWCILPGLLLKRDLLCMFSGSFTSSWCWYRIIRDSIASRSSSSVPVKFYIPYSDSGEGRIMGCSEQCNWCVIEDSSQKGLFSFEVTLGKCHSSENCQSAQGNCWELRERELCDSNVNFESSEGNSHSLQISVSVSTSDSSEAWMRTRDWLTWWTSRL